MAPGREIYRLCLVTDRDLAGTRGLVSIVGSAVAGGVTMVQLREKTAPTRAFVNEARALMSMLRPLGIPLLINDRADVALAVGADGVHVGQDDMDIDMLRHLLGPNALIGLSITKDSDLAESDATRADYLGIGPIFPQSTKPDAASPIGIAGLAAMRRRTTTPILAIGGITVNNAASILEAGADGLAVVSAIMAAADPAAAASAFRSITM
ncbi:thiamine phosphate synthase [Lichenihabitans psoromatis]|uniref:thiamine phosphate synthase n=1 Tax=Lichenihabitans psoromatis TaxID=2528642 RepID=UPI0010383980|nr:thiamine phosphate synthase [Lichenihabitans psoromatis]